jgi:hypothetical protein
MLDSGGGDEGVRDSQDQMVLEGERFSHRSDPVRGAELCLGRGRLRADLVVFVQIWLLWQIWLLLLGGGRSSEEILKLAFPVGSVWVDPCGWLRGWHGG